MGLRKDPSEYDQFRVENIDQVCQSNAQKSSSLLKQGTDVGVACPSGRQDPFDRRPLMFAEIRRQEAILVELCQALGRSHDRGFGHQSLQTACIAAATRFSAIWDYRVVPDFPRAGRATLIELIIHHEPRSNPYPAIDQGERTNISAGAKHRLA